MTKLIHTRLRIFNSTLDKKITTIIINDLATNHKIKSVLRLKIADKLELFNASGLICLAQIRSIDKDKITLNTSHYQQIPPPKLNITLATSIIKPHLFIEMLRLSTQIGVAKIQPVICKYTQKINVTKFNNIERLQKIISETAAQSRNNFPPVLLSPMSFTEFITINPDTIVAHPCNSPRLNITKINSTPKIIIGPEGGFSTDELAFARVKNAQIWSLNSHILKSEQAGPIACSILSHLLD